MSLSFFKYQGAGNDFIVFDNRDKKISASQEGFFRQLCDRKIGVGADGLILLEQGSKDHDFEMVYFNADGKLGSLCGNGGRCIVAFARSLKIIGPTCTFLASDGIHTASIKGERVKISMHAVSEIQQNSNNYILDTGSPHFVQFIEGHQLSDFPVFQEGQKIRYSNTYKEKGINVNFVTATDAGIKVRTYERGVENETLSCGTGVTACAIAHAVKNNMKGRSKIDVSTEGGDLSVYLNYENGHFNDIFLEGPAQKVFEGSILPF